MNENINLVEILKDCPEGTELYSAIHGKVFIQCVKGEANYPIKVYMPGGDTYAFTKEGKAYNIYDGECVLFPAKEHRDWNLVKLPRFNPKEFKPFDKVLVKDWTDYPWRVALFSHISEKGKIVTAGGLCFLTYVIPYNKDTAHLVGTRDDCLEYYKWWKNN